MRNLEADLLQHSEVQYSCRPDLSLTATIEVTA